LLEIADPITDGDDDFPALRIAVNILGGNTDSHIWNRLRETEAWLTVLELLWRAAPLNLEPFFRFLQAPQAKSRSCPD